MDNPEKVLRKPTMAEQPEQPQDEEAVVPLRENEEEGARLNISTDTFVPPARLLPTGHGKHTHVRGQK